MNAEERLERAVQAAQAELEAGIQDAMADWGDDPPVDDIAHDIAQSIALGIRDARVRREFLRREGVIDPTPVLRFDQPVGRSGGSYYGQRKPANDETRAKAQHGGLEWTNGEDAIVLEWDHTEEHLYDLAVRLGRSTEATRQRFHRLHREPRDGAAGTSGRTRAVRAAGGRTATPQPLPDPCPRCGLVHPGEC